MKAKILKKIQAILKEQKAHLEIFQTGEEYILMKNECNWLGFKEIQALYEIEKMDIALMTSFIKIVDDNIEIEVKVCKNYD